LSKVVDEFVSKYPRTAYANATKDSPQLPFPELKDYIQKYQDPQQADSIMKIQKELDETKIVLHKTIESVLDRGEKIDNLVAKSDGLSAQSKMFYTQVRLLYLVLCYSNRLTLYPGKEAKLLLHRYVNTHQRFFPNQLPFVLETGLCEMTLKQQSLTHTRLRPLTSLS
jgi:hypothetical protein